MLRILPYRPVELRLEDQRPHGQHDLVRGELIRIDSWKRYVVVGRIKLGSLGDHSTRSTNTGDYYSTGFLKESHNQLSYHINSSHSNDGLHGLFILGTSLLVGCEHKRKQM